ncbi:nucleoside phosphatase GDA1/CD39 [Syncephalis fuscata]|nr:nucleoside phosphatase GDA1/CD39 [Syncephalis fuscata]
MAAADSFAYSKDSLATNEQREYVIVIDAGSSGSRVHVYSWKSPEIQRNHLTPAEWVKLPVVELGNGHGFSWQYKQEPGLSTFADRPQLAYQHLTPLVDFAKGIIPSDTWARTSVYLFATAGMRLVPEKERVQVLEAVCSYLQSSSPFSVNSCSDHIKTISGETEGVYGWVTVNYLLGGFEKVVSDGNVEPESNEIWPASIFSTSTVKQQTKSQGRTLGFSDMGGASTQLVFEPSIQVADEHRHDMTEVRLRRLDGSVARHDVFVATFLGYGTNQARQRHITQLKTLSKPNHSSAGNTYNLSDPCLPVGLEELLADGTRVIGGGSFAKCLEHTLPLLNKTIDCPEAPCLFNGVHTPEIDYQRLVVSMHDILGLGGAYDAETFEKTAHHFCELGWKYIVAEHAAGRLAPGTTEERLRLQCFKAAWLANILHEGFGLPRTLSTSIAATTPRFQSLDNANGIPFSWTLGAAMMHAVSPVEVGSVVGPMEAATFRHWWTTTWRAASSDGWPPADASPLLPWVWLTIFVGYFLVVARMAWLIRRFARKRSVTHLGYIY